MTQERHGFTDVQWERIAMLLTPSKNRFEARSQLLRLFSDIHTQAFSRSTMSRLIESQPLVALQLTIRCRISNY